MRTDSGLMQPITVSDFLTATGGWAINFEAEPFCVEQIVTDSRTVRPGSVFWAIAGESHDGHDYIDEAARRGAVACVGELERIVTTSLPTVGVECTRRALARFANWYRMRQEALVIGITGSVGKTTTRHMIHTVLSRRFNGVQSPHNYNNELGLPLSLLETNPEHEFAVLELAAARRGDIRTLCEIALPEVGVLTRIAPAHLADFGDIETITRTKGELLEALPKSGFAVLNGDDERVRSLEHVPGCPTFLVGEQPHNDLIATDIRSGNQRLRFTVDGVRFELPAVGRQHLTSALAAIAVAVELEMTSDEIWEGLRQYTAPAGRGRVETIGEWTIIDDTYNASPAAMEAACMTLSGWQTRGQKILIAGDMHALGEASERYHEQLGRQVAACGIDRLLVLGQDAQTAADQACAAGMDAGCIGACEDIDTLRLHLQLWLEPHDVVLVKGSRAMRMERVIEEIRRLAGGESGHVTQAGSKAA
jgi:UDP-N-acetylmuramoyl-tripeptide--D-alanyl-D-alanine ligase